MRLVVELPKEFDWKINLGYLARSSNECMFEIDEEVIRRVIEINGQHFLIAVSMMDSHQLAVDVLGDIHILSSQVCDEIVKYVREWLDLNRDLKDFYNLAASDDLLNKPAKLFYGLRNIGVPDLFEALCWGILGQQINLTFAYTLKRRVVENFGRSIEWDGKKYWIFPRCEEIARLEIEDLTPLQLTKRKSEYLIGVAKLMASGEISKAMLLDVNDFKKAEKVLVSIRGIGPWTANYILMRCLRYPNAFPVDDVGLINSIKELKGLEEKPSKLEILEHAKDWKGWESYATFYLWRLLY